MFEVKQELMNPKFEGYRLASAEECITRQIFHLPSNAYTEDDSNASGTQFQVLADRIYRNQLFLGGSDKLRLFLANGQVLEAERTLEGLEAGFKAKGSIPITGIPSSAGKFISNGKTIFISENGEWEPLSIELDYDTELTLLDCLNDNLILFYQVVEVTDKLKQHPVFMATLLNLATRKKLAFKSKTRPLVGKIIGNQTVWLGSPTGFYFASDVDADADSSADATEPLGYGLDELDDEEAEEISEEAALNHLVLRSFSLDGEYIPLGPPCAFIGSQISRSGSLLLAIQSGIDMTIHNANGHLGIVNAFAFIQSGKSQKKFIAFSPKGSLALIAETSRTAYVYDHTGIDKGEWARQFLLDFSNDDNDEDGRILGVQSVSDNAFLLLFPTRLELIKLAA